MSPTASAGLVGWLRESTPPIALGSFLKSSKHCVKLAAATREENDRKKKKNRVRTGRMLFFWGGRENGEVRMSKPAGIYLGPRETRN